ncbi:FadR/GntR family transcriptional regulator [Bacillus massiliigorillae]|uniref:FadR/GntR family transcriptional regulator n=1 Tax=Bacillus massiliigorillae TaxID=1243664 RepID=UPI0003A88B44|nr:FadR/GntR family transcriptional regulator [Bacillus massiliigorillae]
MKLGHDLLYIDIAVEIENKIYEGVYKKGDKLPSERELTNTYEVSRNVIRQAITSLREKGLVTVKPGKGAYVTELEDSIVGESLLKVMQKYDYSVEDILEVREELERLIVTKAIERATSTDIEKLKQVYNRMEKNKNSLNEFLEEDMNFHMAIAESTHNPIFFILIQSFFEMTDHFSFAVSKFTKDLMDIHTVVLEQHNHLIEAIEKKDKQLAQSIMQEHLNVTKEEVAFLKSKELI